MVGSYYSSHNHKTYFCCFCLHGFSGSYRAQDLLQYRRTDEEMKQKLRDHGENCFAFAAQCTEFPNDPIVKFKNVQNQVEAPFTVYADFETILRDERWEQVPRTYSFYAYQIVINVRGIEFEPRLHVGVDAADHFLDIFTRFQ